MAQFNFHPLPWGSCDERSREPGAKSRSPSPQAQIVKNRVHTYFTFRFIAVQQEQGNQNLFLRHSSPNNNGCISFCNVELCKSYLL